MPVTEPISGDPSEAGSFYIISKIHMGFDKNIQKSYGPVTSVEKINVGYGVTFYRLKFDSGYNRDIEEDGAIYGNFKVEPSTKIIGNVSAGSTIVDVESTVSLLTGEVVVNYSNRTTGGSILILQNLQLSFLV